MSRIVWIICFMFTANLGLQAESLTKLDVSGASESMELNSPLFPLEFTDGDQQGLVAMSCAAPTQLNILGVMPHEILFATTFDQFGGALRVYQGTTEILAGGTESGNFLFNLTDLSPGTEYEIRVTNFCDEGKTEESSALSKETATSTQGSCGSPVGFEFTEITTSSFEFAVTFGTYGGHIRIYDEMGNLSTLPQNFGPNATSVALNGLKNDDEYNICVWNYCNAQLSVISQPLCYDVKVGDIIRDCVSFSQISRWLLHAPRVGGVYKGSLLFYNLSSSTRDLTLSAFDNQGTHLESVDVTFAGKKTVTHPMMDLFSTSEVAVIGICGSDLCRVSMVYENISEPTPCVVPETLICGENLGFTSGGAKNWDGIAGLNISTTKSATVEIVQYDSTGDMLDSTELEIQPTTKTVINLYTDLFTKVEGSYFEIHSDSSICLIALRGLEDRTCGDALFTNPIQILD